MIVATFLCDQCAGGGTRRLADYVRLTSEASMFDPPCEVSGTPILPRSQWHMLCARHHAVLPAKVRSAYLPTDNTLPKDF